MEGLSSRSLQQEPNDGSHEEKAGMARLIVKSGDESSTVELDAGEAARIGRDPANQVPLGDAQGVSRQHCQITPVSSGGRTHWELVDLGATNKTRVNGKPTDRVVLTTGDVIRVGKVEITFEDPDEEAALKDAGSKGVCYLEWVGGDKKGDKIWLDAPRVTFGRRESNTVPLDDRMSSGHHCEITKDLNGYTIRDLGSTNGTLLNGEPTTEATLTHGNRIRIGNSRFAFKDPSMKDIEVELSQFEEDGDWGMMGDIDLTKAKGSYAGLLIGLVIMGGAAFGGWWISQQPPKSETESGDRGNLVAGGTYDNVEDAADLPWTTDADEESVSVSVDPKAGRNSPGLLIRNLTTEEEGGRAIDVLYSEEFDLLAREPLRVEAAIRRRSGSGEAQLLATWHNVARSLAHTIEIGHAGPGWSVVGAELPKPTWASSLSLGVRVAPGVALAMDDVRVTRVKEGGSQLVSLNAPGGASAHADATGGLDIVDSIQEPLVVGARPVAKLADGTVLHGFSPSGDPTSAGGGVEISGAFDNDGDDVPATIRWSTTEEGVKATVTCAGAAAVGVAANLPRAQVGDLVNVLTGTRALTLPASGGATVDDVRKTLAGSTDQSGGSRFSLVTFVPDRSASLALNDALDDSILNVVHWVKGGEGAVELVTHYDKQRDAAQAALTAGLQLLRERPGEGIERLREIAQEFPFDEAVKRTAGEKANAAEKQANEDVAALKQALDAFRIYGSEEALDDVSTRLAALQAQFPPREGGGGIIESEVAEIAAAVESERADYYARFAGPELSRLERLADLLKGIEGYKPMAAMFYRAIVTRFAHLKGDDTPLGRRVLAAQKNFDELMANKSVADAVPPAPAKKGN